jgi:hypothetical protein
MAHHQGPRDDPRPATSSEADIAAYRVPFGNGWTGIGPPGLIDGRALTWPHLPPEYGHAPPCWTGPSNHQAKHLRIDLRTTGRQSYPLGIDGSSAR